MNTGKDVTRDERTEAVMRAASALAMSVIIFGLLIDIMFRAAVFHEAAWDLFALLVLDGAIITVYMARHKVLGQMLGRRPTIGMAVGALVGALLGAALAAVFTMMAHL